MKLVLLLITVPALLATPCYRSKITTEERKYTADQTYSEGHSKAIKEISKAIRQDTSGQIYTNPFRVKENVERTRKIISKSMLLKRPGEVAAAVKQLTAYDKNDEQIAQIDYIIVFGDHFSVLYSILDPKSFEQAAEVCEQKPVKISGAKKVARKGGSHFTSSEQSSEEKSDNTDGDSESSDESDEF